MVTPKGSLAINEENEIKLNINPGTFTVLSVPSSDNESFQARILRVGYHYSTVTTVEDLPNLGIEPPSLTSPALAS